MNDPVITVKLKVTNCYLIRGSKGYVMVDAGPPKTAKIFQAALQEKSIDPGEIKLIFITHGHWDHWGSLKAIRDMTGAEIAINYREKPWLEEKQVRIPRGFGAWGKSLFVLLPVMKPSIKAGLETLVADTSLPDEDHSLEPYGIKGRIVHTPGHTDGSMSLLLDSGDAFVGDLAMSGFPRIQGPGPFVLGTDINEMKRSWQLLLDAGAVKIWPSHGKPFSARVFDEYYKTRD
jgi:glyoxylase-like metal-dependent hydrolase (beta-lactamase superfamily II)